MSVPTGVDTIWEGCHCQELGDLVYARLPTTFESLPWWSAWCIPVVNETE